MRLSHSLATRRVDDRTMRIALFTPDNTAFVDNDDAILELIVKANAPVYEGIEIVNILASDSQAHEYVLTSTGGKNANQTSVENVSGDNVRIETASDAINILNADGREIAIVSADGTVLSHFTAKSDFESCKVVKGIYMVVAGNRTEKVIVK